MLRFNTSKLYEEERINVRLSEPSLFDIVYAGTEIILTIEAEYVDKRYSRHI